MIRTTFYFIISSFLLFFSANLTTNKELKVFADREQAIYRIHSNVETESYSTITIDRVEILPRTILKTGTPNTFIKLASTEKPYKFYINIDTEGNQISFPSILDRYKYRILRI